MTKPARRDGTCSSALCPRFCAWLLSQTHFQVSNPRSPSWPPTLLRQLVKCLDRITLTVNGVDVKLGIHHIVRLVLYLIQLLFRRDKQHGHQIDTVSKALPLWRRSICHSKFSNTRQAIIKFCHGSSGYVCARLRQVFVRICVWVWRAIRCAHH